MKSETAATLDELGIDIDPRAVLGTLSTARQQMVAIARGVSLGAKVLVLDEPTSSLAEREVAILYELIRRLQAKGTGIVYISHRFDELYTVCNRVTVLRDGKLVGTRDMQGLERIDLVCLMLGKSREALQASGTTGFGVPHAPVTDEAPLLRVRDLRRGSRLHGVTLEVRRGEVVGLAGLLGSGRTETARALFGAEPAEGGSAELRGRPLAPHTPTEGIEAGIGFLSEDRKIDGIIPELSIRENLTLAALPTLTRFGIVSRAKQDEIVSRFMTRLGIKATSAEQRIRELSGGNQQKVLLARWMCTQPALLILDEPTRGVDIGAKAEIQSLVNELAASGLGVLMISSELEELVEGSARVVVMRDGRTVAELSHDQLSQDAIIQAMADDDGVPGIATRESADTGAEHAR
jgi:ribose transport system ATP-binding protein